MRFYITKKSRSTMVLSNHVIGWLVLLPLSTLSMGAAILAITLYRGFRRTLDVFLLSVLVALLLHVALCTAVHAYTSIGHDWGPVSCSVYVWNSFAMRTSELLSLVALSLDRSAIFRFPSNYNYRANHQVAAQVFSMWTVSALIGSVPLMRLSAFPAVTGNQCSFSADVVYLRFAVAMAIFEMAGIVSCLIISLDTMVQWRYISENTMFNVRPAVGDMVANDNTGELQERSRSHIIASACDNCRIACIFSAILLLLNHLPNVVLVFIGAVTTELPVPAQGVIQLWFLAVAGFVAPNCLWLYNAHYRAAYIGAILRVPMPSTRKETPVMRLQSYKQHRRLQPTTAKPELTEILRIPSSSSELPVLAMLQPLSNEYISDIWRPVTQPRHGSHLQVSNSRKTLPPAGHRLHTAKAVLSSKNKSKRHHSQRQPPDGSSKDVPNDRMVSPQTASSQCFHEVVAPCGSSMSCTGTSCTTAATSSVNNFHRAESERYSPSVNATPRHTVAPPGGTPQIFLANHTMAPPVDLLSNSRIGEGEDSSNHGHQCTGQCSCVSRYHIDREAAVEMNPWNLQKTVNCACDGFRNKGWIDLEVKHFETAGLNTQWEGYATWKSQVTCWCSLNEDSLSRAQVAEAMKDWDVVSRDEASAPTSRLSQDMSCKCHVIEKHILSASKEPSELNYPGQHSLNTKTDQQSALNGNSVKFRRFAAQRHINSKVYPTAQPKSFWECSRPERPRPDQMKNSRSKRQQWLERMRAQYLPAAYMETLPITGSYITPPGLMRMRARSLLASDKGRKRTGSADYKQIGFRNVARADCFEVNGFQNYRNTVDRKGKIKFRRRRRVSGYLENGL